MVCFSEATLNNSQIELRKIVIDSVRVGDVDFSTIKSIRARFDENMSMDVDEENVCSKSV